MNSPDGGPAFPLTRQGIAGETVAMEHGISKLDYFAAKAMQALVAANPTHPVFCLTEYPSNATTSDTIETLVLRSYNIAEKMVEESQ